MQYIYHRGKNHSQMWEFFVHRLVLAWVGKYVYHRKNDSSVSLPVFCLFTRTQGFASDTSGHQFSPHQAILCDTDWASYLLTQFWHYLLGTNVRSHRFRAQPTSLTSFQVPGESNRSPGYPQLPSDLATNQMFPWPPPQVPIICHNSL